LTAYGDLISTVRPGEWIKPAVMQARAKKAGYLIGSTKRRDITKYLTMARRQGDLQAAVLPGDMAYVASFAVPGTEVPDGAILVPPDITVQIGTYVAKQRKSSRGRPIIASRDKVFDIISRQGPTTLEEIIDAGPFVRQRVWAQLTKGVKHGELQAIKIDGEPTKYAVA